MKSMPGIVVPLITPLLENENIDVVHLRKLIDHVITRGVEGLFALSTTGEFASLNDNQSIEYVEIVIEENNQRCPLWVGVGDVSTRRVLGKIRAFNGLDIDAFVVTTPYYYSGLSQDDLVVHFITIADQSSKPIILYNIPQNTHVNLDEATLVELSIHQNIIGLKDSSGNVSLVQELAASIPETTNFKIYEGQEMLGVACLFGGAYGLVSALANFYPDLLVKMRTACIDKKIDEAYELQKIVSKLSKSISRGYWLPGIKGMANVLGLGSPDPVLPWNKIDESELDHIRKIVSESGL